MPSTRISSNDPMSIFQRYAMVLACYITSVVLFIPAQAQQSIRKVDGVDKERVSYWTSILPEQPRGFGEPIEQRKRWDSLYQTGKFNRLIAEADSISLLPFPPMTAAIYLSYYGGKDSETSKRFTMKRRMLLTRMIWAECLTNKGKYLPSIINALQDIVNTPTWTFPAEDRNKTNYEGKLYTIGLSSSAYGSDIAQSLYLLRSKLPAALQQTMYERLEQRVFKPVLAALQNGNANSEFGSLTDTGNHNSVTLANVLGAAFAVIPDKTQRAIFAAMAEKYSVNFLSGYLDDGYCTEGIGYYSYGFGHYVFLRELFRQATNGKVDLFNNEKVKKMARFAPAMEIWNGVYPAIGDCEQYIEPGPQLMYYLNKELGLALTRYDDLKTYMEQPALCYLMYYFPNAVSSKPVISYRSKTLPLRDYFKSSGVLTVRPMREGSSKIAATFKGGNNAEQHNHNDVGSYTIVIGDELITGDAGLATYTPKYFTKERYTLFKTPASYGHNVPLVNHVQQIVGKDAKAAVKQSSFSTTKDIFELDIASAYPRAKVQQLIRRFEYSRKGKGSVSITDRYQLESSGQFETAIVTRNKWERVNDSTIRIQGKKETLIIRIDASSSFKINEEVIDEGPMPYTRIAITQEQVSKGYVRLLFESR